MILNFWTAREIKVKHDFLRSYSWIIFFFQQMYGQSIVNLDLGIRFLTEPPARIPINGVIGLNLKCIGTRMHRIFPTVRM